MQATAHGTSSYTVVVDGEDIGGFMATWPGSNLRADATLTFTFDSGNGDLVDMDMAVDGRVTSTHDVDGPALAALSEEAGRFGALQLGLADVVAIRHPDRGPGL